MQRTFFANYYFTLFRQIKLLFADIETGTEQPGLLIQKQIKGMRK